ncbi:MAG: AMP-binding protein [Planctomycetes bacterium]|nr:AMP-binding protein [Planctomycetota bacterium]MBI3844091.1 AMP-binding protein [Planctomycetota bacterium]
MIERNLARNWDRLSLEQQRQLQARKLREFLTTQVYPFSPYYRELFDRHRITPRSIRTLDDLRRIPFTSKADLVPTEQDPSGARKLVLQPDAASIKKHSPLAFQLRLATTRFFHGSRRIVESLGREYRPTSLLFTTGRSAAPMPFALTLYDLEILKEVGGRLLDVLGVDAQQDRGVSLFPYAPHLAFWQVAYCGFARGLLVLNTGGGKAMGTERIIDSISKIRPTMIVGIPGYVYHVLREAREAGVRFPTVKRIVLGGDRATPEMRSRMIELLIGMGATAPTVLSVLGFTEARVCWSECPCEKPSGFHTYPDVGIFECVNPDTGELVPDGEPGELVYTTIDGRGSVVLRYRTGDVLEDGIVSEPCPACRRTVPRLSSRLSRRSSVKDLRLSKIKGTLVNLDQLAAVIADEPGVEEWQIVLKKRNDDPFEVDEVVVCVAPRLGANDREIEASLHRHILQRTELSVNRIEFHPLGDMLERLGMETNLKERRIVDLRTAAPANSPTVAT